MSGQELHCCKDMAFHLSSGELAIIYSPKFREYGIAYLDGGTSYQIIAFCPWCGAKLPESLRDDWFDRVEAMGVDPDSESVPEAFKDDSWWKSA